MLKNKYRLVRTEAFLAIGILLLIFSIKTKVADKHLIIVI